MRTRLWSPLLLLLLLVGLVDASQAKAPRETDWLELMPKADVEAMLAAQSQATIDHNSRGTQVGSDRTVAELDGTKIKLAGYIVPVLTTDDGQLSEFFIVPYFGACIHVPPPPPNQIILARLEKPIAMTEIYDAFWVTGTLKIETTDSETAKTAYSMAVDEVKLYE